MWCDRIKYLKFYLFRERKKTFFKPKFVKNIQIYNFRFALPLQIKKQPPETFYKEGALKHFS